MFLLVTDIHLSDISCLYWQKQQWIAPCRILRMSVNEVSTIFSFVSSVIHVLIGSRHPFTWYWQPLLVKTTATCSLPHPENQRQRSVNSFSCYIFGNQGIVWIVTFMSELLTALIGNNTIYQRWKTDSKWSDIASCKASKDIILGVENAILIWYY